MAAEPKSKAEHAADAVLWIRGWCANPVVRDRIPGVDKFWFTTANYIEFGSLNRDANLKPAGTVQVELSVYDVVHQMALHKMRLRIYCVSHEIIIQTGSFLEPNNSFTKHGMLDSLVLDFTNIVCTESVSENVAAVMTALAEQAVFETTQATQAFESDVVALQNWHRAVTEVGRHVG